MRNVLIDSFEEINRQEYFDKSFLEEVFEDLLYDQVSMTASTSIISHTVMKNLQSSIYSQPRILEQNSMIKSNNASS